MKKGGRAFASLLCQPPPFRVIDEWPKKAMRTQDKTRVPVDGQTAVCVRMTHFMLQLFREYFLEGKTPCFIQKKPSTHSAANMDYLKYGCVVRT